MNSESTMSIAREFSHYPAGRIEEDGPFNGERFRRDFLLPRLNVLSASGRMVVDFDGIAGAGSSFLEEAFGGLVRVEGFNEEQLKAKLVLRTSEGRLQDLVSLAWMHIRNAESLMR